MIRRPYGYGWRRGLEALNQGASHWSMLRLSGHGYLVYISICCGGSLMAFTCGVLFGLCLAYVLALVALNRMLY